MSNRLDTIYQEAIKAPINNAGETFSLDSSTGVTQADFNLDTGNRLASLVPVPNKRMQEFANDIFGQKLNWDKPVEAYNFTADSNVLNRYAKAEQQKVSGLQDFFGIDPNTSQFIEAKETQLIGYIPSIADPASVNPYKYPKGKEILYGLSKDDLGYVIDTMTYAKPDSFPKGFMDAAIREEKVKGFIDKIKAFPESEQTKYIAILVGADIFGVAAKTSELGINPAEATMSGVNKSDTSVAIEAAGRVLAERNNVNPVNVARIATLGTSVLKTAIEFWMLPNLLGKTVFATPAKFALQSAVQMPRQDETAIGRIEEVAQSFAMGGIVKYTGVKMPSAATRIPTLVGIFTGIPLLEGKPFDEAIESGVTVLGFEALNLGQQAYKVGSKTLKESFQNRAIKLARINDAMTGDPKLENISDAEVGKMIDAMVAVQQETTKELLSQPITPSKDKPTQIKGQILDLIGEAQITKDLPRLEEISNQLEALDKEYELLQSLDTKSIGELHKIADERNVEVPKGTTKTGLVRLIRGENIELATINREAQGQKTIQQNPDGTFTVWNQIAKGKAGTGWESNNYNTIEEARAAMAETKSVAEPVKQPAIATEKPSGVAQVKETPTEPIIPATETKTVEVKPIVGGETPEKAASLAMQPAKPVETVGKEKESTYFKRVNARLEGALGANPTYNQMNIADQTAKSIQFVADNPKEAKRIALGYSQPPKDILGHAISAAYAEKLIMDNKLPEAAKALTSLTLRATRYGQESAALAGVVNDNSPASLVAKVIDARMKNVLGESKVGQDKGKTKTAKMKQEVKNLKNTLEGKNLDISEAQKLLDDLIC